jgi:hypothetical protein
MRAFFAILLFAVAAAAVSAAPSQGNAAGLRIDDNGAF